MTPYSLHGQNTNERWYSAYFLPFIDFGNLVHGTVLFPQLNLSRGTLTDLLRDVSWVILYSVKLTVLAISSPHLANLTPNISF